MSEAGDMLGRFMTASSLLELRMISADPSTTSNISYKDMLYLDIIHDTEGCTVSKLAELACVTKPTVAVRINSMVKRGLVVKVPSETDGRVIHIELSESTREIYRKEWSVFSDIAEGLRSRFGDNRLDEFVEMIDSSLDLMGSCDFRELS